MTDYIKRDDAIDAIGEAVADGLPNGWYTPLIGLPSADVAPIRHGRWIESSTDIICSVCETVFNDEITCMCRDYFYGNPKYCPYCGAKMDGGDGDVTG